MRKHEESDQGVSTAEVKKKMQYCSIYIIRMKENGGKKAKQAGES